MKAIRISPNTGMHGGPRSVAGLLRRPTSWSSQTPIRGLKPFSHFLKTFCNPNGGTPSLLWGTALFLGTLTVAQAQEGLRPIRGPIVPGFWEENGIWAIPSIAGAVLLLILVILLLWKMTHREKILSPKQRYDRELAEMETLLAEGHAEKVPARLSRVLREYIEASTGIRAPEQTTEEFLANTGGGTDSRISPEAIQDLSSFLALMDEAKYARRLLSPEEMQSLFDSANHFVATHERKEAPR
ncbi:MAG: hypothetical protein ACQKBT_05135 [Puniceicoccales bacterium]